MPTAESRGATRYSREGTPSNLAGHASRRRSRSRRRRSHEILDLPIAGQANDRDMPAIPHAFYLDGRPTVDVVTPCLPHQFPIDPSGHPSGKSGRGPLLSKAERHAIRHWQSHRGRSITINVSARARVRSKASSEKLPSTTQPSPLIASATRTRKLALSQAFQPGRQRQDGPPAGRAFARASGQGSSCRCPGSPRRRYGALHIIAPKPQHQ